MTTTRRILPYVIVIAGLVAGSLAAQSPIVIAPGTPTINPRPVDHVPYLPYPILRSTRALADSGPLSSSVSASGLLHDGAGNEAQTGVGVPGDYHRLSDGSFLVAGRRAGSFGAGIVEHWTADFFGNLSESSQYIAAGSDFTGVVYDENSSYLYLLDGNKKKIWRAFWNGFGSLPQTYATWAVKADVGALNTARDRYLDLVWPSGTNPAFDPGHVYLGPHPDYTTQGRALTGTAGNIVNHLWDWLDGDISPDMIIDSATVSEGSFSLDVVSPSAVTSPLSFEIVHLESGFVRGFGSLASGDDRTTVNLTAPIVIGDSYVARESGTGTTDHWAMRAMRRYGFPETFADGSALRPIFTPPDSFIGNPILTLMLGVEIDPDNPPLVAEQDLFGTLRVGVRSFGDPVIPLGGGQFWLSPTTQVVPAVGKVGPSGHGLIGATIAIPYNFSLIGQVWFVQFEITDPVTAGTVRSEVVGFEILPFF
ncbi:MAG: hypothetical protein AAF604_15290 [Acidobacteriota bacterium]